jgi:hypothetical protein
MTVAQDGCHVLGIDPELPAEQVAAVEDIGWSIDGIARCIEGFNRRQGSNPALLALTDEPGAERVHLIEPIGGVALEAVDEGATENIGRDVVEHEVADRIGHEMELAVAIVIRHLQVDILDRSLPSHHGEGVLLVLVLVDICRIKVSDAPRRIDARVRIAGSASEASGVDHLSRIIGDLISLRRDAGERDEPCRIVEQRRGVGEQPAKLGMVVRGVDITGRALEAEIVAKIPSGDEILGVTRHAAVFEARRDLAVAAAIDADTAPRERRAGLRGDVENAGRMKPVLGRKRTGNQRKFREQTGIEELAETGDSVGHLDSVDTVLHIRVIVADVKVAGSR